MNKIFVEFENENAQRTYPFASGCTTADTSGNKIGTGILLDAVLYPVNAEGELYLSKIGADGVVCISDSRRIIMTASLQEGASSLEFYDVTGLSRHVGTILASSADALSTLVNTYDDRLFKKKETTFASSCIFPIVNDGVTSITVNALPSLDGDVGFSNTATDDIRVSTDGHTLRFDVIPPISIVDPETIQHIYCIVDGRTPFRIEKIPFIDSSTHSTSPYSNTIAVYLDNLDKQDICNNAHRENAIEMADTCEECESSSSCHDIPDPPVIIPETYQVEVVDIPNHTDSAFFLVAPNVLGYDNPLSVTLVDGLTVPKTEIDIEIGEDNVSKLEDTITSKGAVLQVPGLE